MMAGVVDFDPDNWRRAAGRSEESADPAKAANPAKERPTLATLAALADPPLSEDLQRGLRQLRNMPAPRMAHPKNWAGIVRDCLALASGGAQQALALGWAPIELFGWAPERDGVAVWLAGGVPMFTADSCTVRIGAGAYRCMDRRPMPDGTAYLWELGNG